ncbi:PHP domain-containing protein [Zongyangia hominis]|uniref:PHP domain-containing protein n=1 Tax=Zongyangia hominis TaxID=2763677 RepID=A0A926EEN2_9FIRM|nr:PHP domain-containing protein [Zongyangia hominis]MBC8570491.1 PHP domain-containing protein [Zongyangia hominis]
MRDKEKVDLHIHSTCSDGTMTPEAICARAAARGVGLMAICDHNCLDALGRLEATARKEKLRWVTGVELDCGFENRVYHVLGYGFSAKDAAFRKLVRENRRKLDQMSVDLLKRMEEDFPQVSLEEFLRYPNNPARGGWAALNYFLDKGIASNFDEVMQLYGKYKCSYAKAGFVSMEEACAAIHAAGGRAVLAHPGYSIKGDRSQYQAALRRMLLCGLDGIECYYPLHTPQQREDALALCRERDLLITSGSDCHGDFQKTYEGGILDIGVNDTRWEEIRLGDIAVQGENEEK